MDLQTKKVFNYILNNGGCMQLKELQTAPSPLSKLRKQDAEEWLVSCAKENQHFAVECRRDGGLFSVRLYFKTRFCLKYQETGSCKTPACKYGWHICKGYVEGDCTDAEKCHLLHDLHDPRNSRIITELGFENWVTDGTIRKIISNCVPHVCTDYVEKKCKQPRKCPHLHVCPNLINNFRCDGDCSFSHNLEDRHNKEILSKFELSPYMKPIKIVLVNILPGKAIKCSVPSGEKKQEVKKQDEAEACLNTKLNDLGRHEPLREGLRDGRERRERQAALLKYPDSRSNEENNEFSRIREIREAQVLHNPCFPRGKGREKHGKNQCGGGKTTSTALTKPCFSDLPHELTIPLDSQDAHCSLKLSSNESDEHQPRYESPKLGSRQDQFGLQQQMFKLNINNKDTPSQGPQSYPDPSFIPETSNTGQRSRRCLRSACSVDNLCKSPHNSGMLAPSYSNPDLTGGLEPSGQFETSGRGNSYGRARGRARSGHGPGQRHGERFEETQARVEEIQASKYVAQRESRGGGRGQRGRGRGRGVRTRGATRGQRSKGRGVTEQLVSECYQLVEKFQEVDSPRPASIASDSDRKINNLNEPTSQSKKKEKSRRRKKSNQQEVSRGAETPSSQTDVKHQLIDFSDGSDEDSSTLLIDLSTDLSQDQHLYNPMSQTDLNFEDWLGESTFSQDSGQSLSQCDPFELAPLQVLHEEPSSSQMECQPLPLHRPPIVADHTPSEKAVFDVLCSEYSCIARFSEISSRKDLFPPAFTDIDSWFRKWSNSFQITENERGEIDVVSAFSRTARVCFKYNGSSGNCNNKKCSYFHVCNEMVASEFCSYGVTCTMNHNLQDKRSRTIARRLKLNDLTDDQLCALIRVSSPQVCLEYNRDGCKRDEKCDKVHICKDFVRKKCSDTGECDLMHEEALVSPHTQTVLDRLKIPATKISPYMLVRMFLVCEDPDTAKAQKLLRNASHIHDDSNVGICAQFVLGKCRKGLKCPHHHCPMPYQWQYCETGQDEKWMSFSEETNEDLERFYCDVTNPDELDVSHFRGLLDAMPRLHPGSNTIKLNLLKMNAGNDFVGISIRRLSTESYATSSIAMATKWVWYWLDDDNSWKEYGYGQIQCESPVQQKEIESSFQRQAENPFYSFSTAQHSYRLFFHEPMYQQNMSPKSYTTRSIKRRPLFCSHEDVMKNKRVAMKKGEKQKPMVRGGSWRAMPEGQEFIRVPLSPGSHEYKDIERLFCQTMSPDRATIVKIERVQNQEMWDSYERKMTTKAESLGNAPEERFLFHSVAENMADSMCAQNLDCSNYSGNATAFGHGVYFACQASFSDRYSSENPGSNRLMFVANVLVGSYTTGDPSMHSPPVMAPYDDPFDSCVDDVQRPSVFVLFDKDQYYLAYLIEYSNTNTSTSTESEDGNTESLEAGATDQADSCLLM